MSAPESHRTGFDPLGVWRQILTEPAAGSVRPGLFLDRDGVIVEEVCYLSRVEDVAIIPGACEAITAANQSGIPAVIITNQAGIAHGLYGWDEFLNVQDFIIRRLAESGAVIDAVFACAHHPNGVGSYAHPNHPARKPRPGMLLAAAAELGLDLKRSWIVGDKTSDLEAGRAAGLTGAIHVLTGHGHSHRESASGLGTAEFAVLLANSIADTVPVIKRISS